MGESSYEITKPDGTHESMEHRSHPASIIMAGGAAAAMMVLALNYGPGLGLGLGGAIATGGADTAPTPAAANNALEFNATTPVNDSGWVTVQRSSADTSGLSANPLNFGLDFTIEMWLYAGDENTETGQGDCNTGTSGWTTGNIFLDADVNGGANDETNFGMSLTDGNVMAFAGDGTTPYTICSTSDLRDSTWHHVAFVRDASEGRLDIYIDGTRENTTTSGPTGSISFNQGSDNPKDALISFGKEKFNFGPDYTGWIDEARFSDTIRYTGASFTAPSAAFTTDQWTASLFHFDTGSGTALVNDTVGGIVWPDAFWDPDGAIEPKGAVASPIWITSNAPTN